MRRLSTEDGAVAVVVAVLLVVFFAIAALVIEIGQLYWERAQLQNGADAAALALAAECAEGDIIDCATAAPVDLGGVAQPYADDNAYDQASAIPDLMPHGTGAECEPGGADAGNPLTDGTEFVKVTTRTVDANNANRPFLTHVFHPLAAALTGQTATETTAVRACAVASWGNIGYGPAIVPLTFSTCEWEEMTGGQGADALPTASKTVVFHSDTPSNACPGPAGQDMPGGFGWTGLDGSGTCSASVPSDQWVKSEPGSGSPTPANSTGCTDEFFLEHVAGQTILLPIFSDICHNGTDYENCPPSLPNFKHYYIAGFAALEVEGYRFGGSSPVYNPPCSNPERCIRGRFVEYFDYGTQPDPGAPNYGAVGVSLTD